MILAKAIWKDLKLSEDAQRILQESIDDEYDTCGYHYGLNKQRLYIACGAVDRPQKPVAFTLLDKFFLWSNQSNLATGAEMLQSIDNYDPFQGIWANPNFDDKTKETLWEKFDSETFPIDDLQNIYTACGLEERPEKPVSFTFTEKAILRQLQPKLEKALRES